MHFSFADCDGRRRRLTHRTHCTAKASVSIGNARVSSSSPGTLCVVPTVANSRSVEWHWISEIPVTGPERLSIVLDRELLDGLDIPKRRFSTRVPGVLRKYCVRRLRKDSRRSFQSVLVMQPANRATSTSVIRVDQRGPSAERERVRRKRMAEPLTERGRAIKEQLDLPTSLIRKQERRVARAILKRNEVPKDPRKRH